MEEAELVGVEDWRGPDWLQGWVARCGMFWPSWPSFALLSVSLAELSVVRIFLSEK